MSIRLDLEHIGDETKKARLKVSQAWDAVLLANKPQVHGNGDLFLDTRPGVNRLPNIQDWLFSCYNPLME